MSEPKPIGGVLLSISGILSLYATVQFLLARYVSPGGAIDGLAQGGVLFIAAISMTERAVTVTSERWRLAVGAVSFLLLVPFLFSIGLFIECRWRPTGCDV